MKQGFVAALRGLNARRPSLTVVNVDYFVQHLYEKRYANVGDLLKNAINKNQGLNV